MQWISCTIPGTPPSVNELPLDTRNPRYRRVRNAWMQDMAYAFNEAGNVLPRRLSSVRADVVLSFTTNRRRDSGNYKAHVEKMLGDVLQSTGRLRDDTHDIYRFGEATIIVDPNAPAGHFVIIEYKTESQ